MSSDPTYVAQLERAHDGMLIAGVPEGISARRFAPERGRGKYLLATETEATVSISRAETNVINYCSTPGKRRGRGASVFRTRRKDAWRRDQIGASEVYYDLVRADRPLTEIISEVVRIHAPCTHVPYHERIDDGYPNFVNNDHCLLSARATLESRRDAVLSGFHAADGANYLVHPVGTRHLESKAE